MFSPLYIYLITIIKLYEVTTLDAQFIAEKGNSLKAIDDDNKSTKVLAQNVNYDTLSPKASSLHQIILPYKEGK